MNVQLISTHVDGSAHRIWLCGQTTTEPWVFRIPQSSPVRDADGRVWSSDYPVVAFFWPQAYAQVMMLLKANGTEYYCNLITPPVYDPASFAVRFADLDLDVYVSKQGVQVLDEDEFDLHRGAYPVAVVDRALAAQATLVRMATLSRGPFSPAAKEHWRALCSCHTTVQTDG